MTKDNFCSVSSAGPPSCFLEFLTVSRSMALIGTLWETPIYIQSTVFIIFYSNYFIFALASVLSGWNTVPSLKGWGFDSQLGHISKMRIHPQSRCGHVRPPVWTHTIPGPSVDPRSAWVRRQQSNASLASMLRSLRSSLPQKQKQTKKKQMKIPAGEDKKTIVSSLSVKSFSRLTPVTL